MSRNPILNDRAFGTEPGGRSPSEEWASAQAGGLGQSAAGGAATGWRRGAQSPSTGHAPGTRYRTGPAASGPVVTAGEKVMTMAGTSAAGLLMLVFIIVGAFVGWAQVSVVELGRDEFGTAVYSATMKSPVLLFGSLIFAFVLAIVTAFKPQIARFTSIPYSLAEGVVLGMISHLYEVESSGIVLQAVLATFAVFAIMLLLYGMRVLRATPKFTKGVIAATFGIVAMYAVGWIISLFSSSFQPFWATGGPLGIGISVVIVIVAAMNLILDFDFIERGSQNRLPAYMDWYAAFGLIVTLVWLYLELLRLLSALRNN